MDAKADDSDLQPTREEAPSLTCAGVATVEADAAAAQRVAGELGMRRVALEDHAIPGELVALVPREIAERFTMLPIGRDGGTLLVAMSDPAATDGLDAIAHLVGGPVQPFLASAAEIQRAIASAYGADAPGGPDGAGEAAARTGTAILSAGTGDADDEAPIEALVQQIIVDAARARASDIHVEPLEQRVRVRYRIDGVMQEAQSLAKRLQLPMISRLKVMANLSIAEKRLPQDGRIAFGAEGRALDLRVSSLPTVHGESVVMRLLEAGGARLALSQLGLSAADEAAWRRLLALQDGMVLVTGPTGCGKSTTLYSCLHHLNETDRKIITVEDPVEYQLAGVNQVPVRPEVGMTFGSALRAMLRQAPNVVMVGEIRDVETAEIAINAALTGHLVFSTLHTNDAVGAVTRLADMGVKPFLVAAALRGVLAQRLVRRVCPRCRTPQPLGADGQAALGRLALAAREERFGRGAGCEACRGTGYDGRLGVFELFVVDEEAQRMIYAGASAAELRRAARRRGLRTLRADGLAKASAGLTTVEEVVSMTPADAD